MSRCTAPSFFPGRFAVFMLVTALSVLSIFRNFAWHSEVSLWSDTIEKSPGKYRAYFHLGNAFLLQNDYGRADTAYRYILSREQEISSPSYRALLHNHIGLIQLNRGGVKESIAEFRKALDAKPDYPIALFNLGIAFEKAGMTDEASDAYRSALDLSPGFAEAKNALGMILLRKGKIPAALEQFEQALAINPSLGEALQNRRLALEMLRGMNKP